MSRGRWRLLASASAILPTLEGEAHGEVVLVSAGVGTLRVTAAGVGEVDDDLDVYAAARGIGLAAEKKSPRMNGGEVP
jgi:hypothetical protein